VGLFFFVFLLVLREGVETVLIWPPYAELDRAAELYRDTAWDCAAVVFGVLFTRGACVSICGGSSASPRDSLFRYVSAGGERTA